jgi:S-methylmethionine-dependent homocysteine/selenocysteine methylase
VSYNIVRQKLARGEVIILDGGTGTDIQRRGAPMSAETWCADVNATHGEIIEAVHRDYIVAGADVITANTFATSPLAFNYRKRDDEVLSLDAAAMAHAKRAAAGTHVVIAGSISTQRPLIPGTDRSDLAANWPRDVVKSLYRRKVENLKTCGADLLITEMMRDADYSVMASEAAMESGLPVWIGISVERRKDGVLTGFGRSDQLVADFAPALARLKPDVICIMHTAPNDVGEAMDVLRQHWTGPVGVYPESGYFKSPDWQFENVIPETELVAFSRAWRTHGATIFGGCCGIGPSHIRALSQEFTS